MTRLVRTSLLLLPLALLCGCRVPVSPAGSSLSRNAVRPAIKVHVRHAERVTLFGQEMTVASLTRRLRREEPGRAILLRAEPGVSTSTLFGIQRQLARAGIPNVSMATARTATAETADAPE